MTKVSPVARSTMRSNPNSDSPKVSLILLAASFASSNDKEGGFARAAGSVAAVAAAASGATAGLVDSFVLLGCRDDDDDDHVVVIDAGATAPVGVQAEACRMSGSLSLSPFGCGSGGLQLFPHLSPFA